MFSYNSNKYQNYFDEYSNFVEANDLGNKYLTEYDEITTYSKYRIFLYKQLTNVNSTKRVFLIVPSLFNSPEIFFLNKTKHFINNLREMGDIFLIEWREVRESSYSLNHYIKKIIAVINKINKEVNLEINLIGHCIGGILALGAATECQKSIKTLTLLTTPWEFYHFAIIIAIHKMLGLDNYIKSLSVIPKMHVQILFFYYSLIILVIS